MKQTNPMIFPCTGVILAGGENKRFSGTDKALLNVNGRSIIARLYSVFSQVFDEIIIVTNTPEKYLQWDALLVRDVFSVRSSLTGIHAGLFYAANPFAFFSACDTPFLSKALVECVVHHIDPKFHAIIPETEKGLEPLCAVYAKESLPHLQYHLSRNHFKIRQVFAKNRMRIVPEHRLRQADKDLVSFFNINSPKDLETACAMKQGSD